MINKPVPCGGCGAASPDQRCIGCMHDFGTPLSDWVRASPPKEFSMRPEDVRSLLKSIVRTLAYEALARAYSASVHGHEAVYDEGSGMIVIQDFDKDEEQAPEEPQQGDG